MVEPISFKPKAAEPTTEMIWICLICSCRTFEIGLNAIKCANCGSMQFEAAEDCGHEWILNQSPPVQLPTRDLEGTTRTIDFNDAAGVKSRQNTLARMDSATLAAVVGIHSDGAINTWCVASQFKTDEEIAWGASRFAAGFNIMWKPGEPT